MKMRFVFRTFLFSALASCLLLQPAAMADTPTISGELIRGFRVIAVDPGEAPLRLTVYRGDYIKFQLEGNAAETAFAVPELGIEATLSGTGDDAPYFKMKKPGQFAFTLGGRSGQLTVVEYRQAAYRELTAEQAEAIIAGIRPFILDVRTPQEYQMARIENAVLIPVQELQRRAGELESYKNQDILIYCATGNRSTVASKILIDRGFKRIYNLRNGIVDWHQRNHPVVR